LCLVRGRFGKISEPTCLCHCAATTITITTTTTSTDQFVQNVQFFIDREEAHVVVEKQTELFSSQRLLACATTTSSITCAGRLSQCNETKRRMYAQQTSETTYKTTLYAMLFSTTLYAVVQTLASNTHNSLCKPTSSSDKKKDR